MIFTPGFSIQVTYSGSYPNGAGFTQMAGYHAESTVPGNLALYSVSSNAFFEIGGEWHEIYGVKAAPTPLSGNQLMLRSSTTNYQNAVAITPLSTTTNFYSTPKKTQFQNQDYLAFESRPTNGATRIDLYQFNGSYTYDRSIYATAPYFNLSLRGVNGNKLLVKQSNGNSAFDQHALLECQ